jgi:4-hydroxy-tetrahydrodipicolinate reductase
MIKIGINGATGRIGSILAKLIKAREGLKLSKTHSGSDPRENLEEMIKASEVIIDFSQPEATMELLKSVNSHIKSPKLVIGTTGLNSRHFEVIDRLKTQLPVFYAENMSRGMHVLNELVESAAKRLDKDQYDAEIIETHHRNKRDVPSGSALKLASQIAAARGQADESALNCHRSPETPERREGEIGCISSRLGGSTGSHSVRFGSMEEIVTLSHESLDKSVFAEGALEAAKWLNSKSSGLWGMEDLLSKN